MSKRVAVILALAIVVFTIGTMVYCSNLGIGGF